MSALITLQYEPKRCWRIKKDENVDVDDVLHNTVFITLYNDDDADVDNDDDHDKDDVCK